MPIVSYERVRRGLRNEPPGGIYFLFGDDAFLKREAADVIVAAHLDPGTRDFNFDDLRGGAVKTETLASVFATPPMMAERRVVVVRDVQELAGSSRARGVIESLFEREVPGLVVVLVADIPSGSRAKFYRVLKREAYAVELSSPDADDAPGWLVDRARAEGLEMDAAAARAVAAAVGTELGVLVHELAKLRDYAAPRTKITTADVEAVVGHVPRQNRWAWFDTVGSAKFAEARAALPVLLDGGESGVGLVLGLGTHFLRLGIAVTGGSRALESALGRRFGWLASRLVAQARRWTPATIDAALDDLLRADRLLKSSALGEAAVLEELLLRLEARASERVA